MSLRQIKDTSGPRRLLVSGAIAVVVAAGLVGGVAPGGQAQVPSGVWGSGTLTGSQLASLVGQMTPEEEVGMLHGYGDPPAATSPVPSVNGEAGGIAGVPRLGIAPLRFTDGPAGIRLRHVETAMPAPVGLAATWDPGAAGQFGSTVSDAGRATGEDVWLAPMINAVNFVTGGRNFETLGEDPYLAGQLVASEVQGVQGRGMIAEIKHYAENDFENGRTSTNVAINDQTLHETELQAFQSAIDAGAGAVMCSYNRINTVYACGNDATLNGVLRGQLGFKGFVTSDWGAVHRVSDLLHGNDIEQPGNAAGTSTYGQQLLDALAGGTAEVAASADFPVEPAHSAAAWKAAVDNSVLAILTEENNAGLLEGTQYGTHFDPATKAPYIPPRPDLDSLRPVAFAIAQAIAERSATLLKNGGALPLSHGDLSGTGTGNGVLVMGPTAIAPYIGGGGSAHVTPYDPVQGPFDALAARAGSHANLRYVPGYDLDGTVIPSTAMSAPDPAAGYPNWTLTAADAAFANQPGLLRQQITTDPVTTGAQPVLDTASDAAPDRVDSTVDYTGANTLPANTAWRWSGLLTAPANPGGTSWQLKAFVANQASTQLFVDSLATTPGRLVNIGAYPAAPTASYAGLTETARSHDPANENLQQATTLPTLSPGQQIHLDLRVYAGAAPTNVQLRWVPPDNQTQSINAAVAAARTAHKVVVFAYDEGTEGRDRGTSDQAAGLQLPGYQDALIQAVAAVNPNTTVVLNTGDAVLMPWAGSVNAILEMWYPGQLGGPATANVLDGAVDPGGKLPITFPADATHFPTYDPNCTDTSTTGNCPLYPGVVGPSPFLSGATTTFRTLTAMQVNGIDQGYRWYDQHNITPLFPFGYGLSYTKFDYSNLTVHPSGGGIDVSFRIRNLGSVTGSDVPQVYLGASPNLPSSVQQAVRKLAQFQRVTLAPGRSVDLTLHVSAHTLSSWSTSQQKWVLGTGTRTVYAGSSSRDLPLHTTTTVTG